MKSRYTRRARTYHCHHHHHGSSLHCLRRYMYIVYNNIYLLIIYAKALHTDVPPFRNVVHKSLSALAKDSPANLHRTGRSSNHMTHICIKQKIALSWVLEGGNIVKGWVANNLCVTVSISND